MLVVFEQVATLFVFAAIGFALCKCGLIKAEHSRLLSTLLVYVFLPCNIFKTYAANFNLQYITEKHRLLTLSLIITLSLMAVGFFCAKLLSKNRYERSVLEYSIVVPNYGYMGYALTESLFGEAGLINIMVFAIPVSLYIYTIGYCKLTKIGLSFKKLLNPVIIATVLGIIVGLAELPIPHIATDVLSRASNCMGPVSMILAGITVSQYRLRALLTNRSAYIITLLRLVIVPVGLGVILTLLGVRWELVGVSVLLFALPCGMNTIVFPRLVGENCEMGASLAFISNILACITVPIIFSVFVI